MGAEETVLVEAVVLMWGRGGQRPLEQPGCPVTGEPLSGEGPRGRRWARAQRSDVAPGNGIGC